MTAKRRPSEPLEEWWVLVDPKTDTWARVSEEEARHFAVVECRSTFSFTDKVVDLYEDDG
jgi:hypothetical protein